MPTWMDYWMWTAYGLSNDIDYFFAEEGTVHIPVRTSHRGVE
jgi:hypothetical protein